MNVDWPLEERAMLYEMGDRRLVGNWRGDTLFRMDPPGPLSPLYRRPLDTPSAPARGITGRVKEIDPI